MPPLGPGRDRRPSRPFGSEHIPGALRFIQYLLLAFAGIAVLVGAFVIFNTFSITVAQRITRVRDAALAWRLAAADPALGPDRGLLLGLPALGARLARRASRSQGPRGDLRRDRGRPADRRHGFRHPHRDRLVAARHRRDARLRRSSPALRATRVPPIAAMREGATRPRAGVAAVAGRVAVLSAVAACPAPLRALRRPRSDAAATADGGGVPGDGPRRLASSPAAGAPACLAVGRAVRAAAG